MFIYVEIEHLLEHLMSILEQFDHKHVSNNIRATYHSCPTIKNTVREITQHVSLQRKTKQTEILWSKNVIINSL